MSDLYPDDNSVAYQNPDLFAMDERLADRKARLKLAAKAAAEGSGLWASPQITPGQSFRSAVTGADIVGPSVKPSLLANLTPVLADIGNAIDQRGYEEDQSGYKRAEAQAAQQHMAQQPPDDAPPSTKLQWAQAGTKIPSLAPVMNQYVADGLIKAPERAEARAERQQTREDALAESQRKQREELEYRRQRDQQAEQLRRDLAAGQDNLRRDLHAAVASSGGKPDKLQPTGSVDENGRPQFFRNGDPNDIVTAPGMKKPEAPAKSLPAAQATAYINNDKSIKQIDQAIASLDTPAGKDAVGWKGYLPNKALSIVSPSGVDTRAAVANIGSLKIHDRSGAAVTAAEAPRLMPFIPLTTDDAPTAKKKLQGLKNELALHQQSIEDYADSQGYRSPSAPPPQKQTNTSTGNLRQDVINANKQVTGGDDALVNKWLSK